MKKKIFAIAAAAAMIISCTGCKNGTEPVKETNGTMEMKTSTKESKTESTVETSETVETELVMDEKSASEETNAESTVGTVETEKPAETTTETASKSETSTTNKTNSSRNTVSTSPASKNTSSTSPASKNTSSTNTASAVTSATTTGHTNPHSNADIQPTTTAHTHNWSEITKTVHHDEVGHYETVTIQAAYDEPVYDGAYVCGGCNKIFSNQEYGSADAALDAVGLHTMDDFYDNCENYHVEKCQVDTIHHDARTEEQWVVDQNAYDEVIVTGYQCSCGATK